MKNRGIYLSIKPQFVDLIVKGKKTYEFRKYIPKMEFEKVYIYETLPNAGIKYVININKIYKYPEKIKENGYGNEDFNNGKKKAIYAYEIGKIMCLKEKIGLEELKSKYKFVPPQSYAYSEKYDELTQFIENNLHFM